ncbi:MAG: aminotransferase class III-fold pyridoxal phosphate-dependent enzyme [Desulfovibrionaceae bacterium]
MGTSKTFSHDISKTLSMQDRALKRIPGLSQLLSKRPDRFSLGVWPTYFSRAKGATVWDLDNNEYLDMSIAGIGANVLGYADPDVDAAVLDAVSRGVSSSLNCPEEVELADLLCELHPWADMARFVRCGGEAMSVAVRIARARTGRDVVAFCGYHGWHDWYLAANVGAENALGGHHITGLDPAGVPQGLAGTAYPFHYNKLEELEAIVEVHGEKLAAIVMESIRSAEPEPGFLEGVRKLADRTGAVLIVDEVSAGLRLCTGGAHLKLFPQPPDMAVFSKALGNGYAMAAVIGKADVMQAAQKTFISSTNWTERIGPVAALATLRKHRDLDAATRLVQLGTKVQQGWKRCAAEYGLEINVGGIPPLSHYGFAGKDALSLKAYFVQCMLDEGILASTLYYAMYAHTDADVERYLDACGRTFALLREAVDKGELAQRLRGLPAAAGFGRLA